MENKQIIGTCSLCGGPVTQYTVLYMVGPWPSPSCEDCGAVMAQPYGPVIPMKPRAARYPHTARRDKKAKIVPDPCDEKKDSVSWEYDGPPVPCKFAHDCKSLIVNGFLIKDRDNSLDRLKVKGPIGPPSDPWAISPERLLELRDWVNRNEK